MQVIERAKTPNGIDIQIEDWHKDYYFMAEASTVATYPQATKTDYTSKLEYPRANERFRLAIRFNNKDEAKQCFDNLKNGTKQLQDYHEHFTNKNYIDYIK